MNNKTAKCLGNKIILIFFILYIILIKKQAIRVLNIQETGNKTAKCFSKQKITTWKPTIKQLNVKKKYLG